MFYLLMEAQICCKVLDQSWHSKKWNWWIWIKMYNKFKDYWRRITLNILIMIVNKKFYIYKYSIV